MRKQWVMCILVTSASLSLPAADALAQKVKKPKADVELTATEPFEFDGSDRGQGYNGVNLAQSPNVAVGTGDFTIHVTVSFASLINESGPCLSDTACDMSLVDKMRSGGVNTDGWRVLKQSDNHFWLCLGGGEEVNGCDPGTPTTVISQSEAVPDTWYKVAAVKTAATISIYVNGILEGTMALGQFANTDSADLIVGANALEAAVLNGSISEVKLFRRALDADQIEALHK